MTEDSPITFDICQILFPKILEEIVAVMQEQGYWGCSSKSSHCIASKQFLSTKVSTWKDGEVPGRGLQDLSLDD